MSQSSIAKNSDSHFLEKTIRYFCSVHKKKKIGISINPKIATKYPNITNNYFAEKGINVNCIKMNGAMEIAPKLEMADKIVDLVSSGKTLIANDLVEIENILEVTSHLVINRTAFKTRYKNIRDIMTFFREALNEKNS